MAIEEYKDIIHRCFRCGYCKFTSDYIDYNCPSYSKFRLETYSTGGRMWLIHGLAKGDLDWTDNLATILYSCTTCGNCMENCRFDKFKGFLVDIIESARSEAFESGFTPEKLVAFGNHAGKEHNPYMEKQSDRLDWLPDDHVEPEDVEIGYFVGCTSSYREKNLARNTYELLKSAGVKFVVLEDEWCCGSPLIRTGQRDEANRMVEHNIKLFTDRGIKKVITSCAGCYRTLKVDYPKLTGKELDFEVLHASEVINQLVNDGKIQLKDENGTGMKVSYHDPCHLGRHAGLYDAPREVLAKMPGIDLVEMRKIRENATCCGAGGGVKAGNPEWALEMATQRLLEAKNTGARVLITTCPFCERNFKDGIKAGEQDIEVLDLVELVNSKMK